MITILAILAILVIAVVVFVTLITGGIYVLFRYIIPLLAALILILAIIGLLKLIF